MANRKREPLFRWYVLFILCTWLTLTGFKSDLLLCEDAVPRFTALGRWGSGPYRGIAVSGGYAYCLAEDTGLDILDISDPTRPIRIGTCSTLGSAKTICLMGSYAYIPIYPYYTHEGGLQVIDISNPSTPVPVGYIDIGSSPDVALCGHYAYTATENTGLVVIDISNPSAPVKVAVYLSSDIVSDVAVAGNYAYMLNRSSLEIIDISNPSAPSRAGLFPMTYNAYNVLDITVNGNYAFLAGVHFGLRIFDISNPGNPEPVGSYDRNMSYGVEVRGDIVCLYGNYGLDIVDVTNLSMPKLMGRLETSAPGFSDLGIGTNGHYAFATNSQEGLKIIDLGDPCAPTLTGSYEDVTEGISDIYVRGQYVYLAERKGLFIIDFTNPTYPTLKSKLHSTYTCTNNIDVNGNYVYLTDSDRLHIIDITNPSLPQLSSSYSGNLHEYNQYFGVKVSNNYAFTTRSDYGFLVLDVSNPESPQLVSLYKPCEYGNIALQGQYAYVVAKHTMNIIDISNPEDPHHTWICHNLTWAEDVAIKNNYAYVTWWSGLSALDITDPGSPLQTHTVNFTTAPGRIFIRDNHIYATVYHEGLRILDIANPSLPHPVGALEIPGGAKGLYIDGNYLFVHGESRELSVYWIGDIPVSVSSPDETAVWPLGSLQTITWTRSTNNQTFNAADNVNIELYRGNLKAGTIAETIPASMGAHSWTVGIFSNGTAFLRPGKRYQVGIRTMEGNYLALSDKYFTIPSSGVLISLQVAGYEEKAWLVKSFYGKLDITVEKEVDAASVEKYLIKRNEDGGAFRKLGEISEGEFHNDSFTFYDTFLERDKSYSYYIEAVNGDGVVYAVSEIRHLKTN